MHVIRGMAWLWDEPLGERRRKPGHFAQLAPSPLAHQTVLCEGDACTNRVNADAVWWSPIRSLLSRGKTSPIPPFRVRTVMLYSPATRRVCAYDAPRSSCIVIDVLSKADPHQSPIWIKAVDGDPTCEMSPLRPWPYPGPRKPSGPCRVHVSRGLLLTSGEARMHRRFWLLLRRNSPTPVMAHARGISAHTLPRAGHVSRMGQRPNQVS